MKYDEKAPESGPPSAPANARGIMPEALRYCVLNCKRPAAKPYDRGYDETVWAQLTDLYLGGYTIQENAARYLPKSPDETDERYQYRIANVVAYINYLGRIVGFFVAMVFQAPLHVQSSDEDDDGRPDPLPEPEVYEAFGRDADLKGSSFTRLIKECLTWAMVKKKAFLCLDFPAQPEGASIATRAEERALEVDRPYAWMAHAEEVLDWRYDQVIRHETAIGSKTRFEWSYGRFQWVVTKRRVSERESPAEKREGIVEEFKIWQKHPPDKTHPDPYVTWCLYRTKPLKPVPTMMGAMLGPEPKHDDTEDVPRVAHGEVSFREIPILEVCVPDALWIGALVGPLNLEHWRRRSTLTSAQEKALHAILWIKYGAQLGDVGGSQPSVYAADQKRGEHPVQKAQEKGALALDKGDDIGYAEIGGSGFALTAQQLEKLADEAYRVASQMAGSLVAQSQALARSGASKSEDKGDASIVCAAYAAIAKDLAVRAHTVIARARDESANFVALGLDTFDVPDRAAALEEATMIPAIAIPSPTLIRELWMRVATDLVPGMDPSKMSEVKKEIEKNVPDEPAMLPPAPGMVPPTAPPKSKPAMMGNMKGGMMAKQGDEPDEEDDEAAED